MGVKYLHRLYPHLTSLKITVTDVKPRRYRHSGISFSDKVRAGTIQIQNMNCNFQFHNLQNIKLSVFSYSAAIDLFSEIGRKRSIIRSVNISVFVPNSQTSEQCLDLISAQFKFLRHQQENLESLIVNVDHQIQSIWITESAIDLYCRRYKLFVDEMKSMVDGGIIYDGYLEFDEKFCKKDTGTGRPRKAQLMMMGGNHRTTSLSIAQSIAGIQNKVRAHNNGLAETDCNGKKLILNLPYMRLNKEHRKFLDFWFGSEGNATEFVLC